MKNFLAPGHFQNNLCGISNTLIAKTMFRKPDQVPEDYGLAAVFTEIIAHLLSGLHDFMCHIMQSRILKKSFTQR